MLVPRLLVLALIPLAGCASPPVDPVDDPLEAEQVVTLKPGWSLWLTYSVNETTTFPFEWSAEGDLNFTVFRTKSSGEDVLYSITATADAGNVTARHPNVHVFDWYNPHPDPIQLTFRVVPGYKGELFQAGNSTSSS